MDRSLVEFLKDTPYFAGFSTDELYLLSPRFGHHDFEPDEYLFLEGDPARWGGIIVSGQIKLIKHSDTGKDLTLDVLGPKRFLGIESMLDSQLYATSAQAMEPSQVCTITARDSVDLLQEYPGTTLAVTRDLSHRLEEAYEMMRSLALERVERRIALNLVKLAGQLGVKEPDGAILINLPLSRQDLADMAGTTIETAIRTMSKFRRQKLVESVDGKVRLLQPHQMVMISEDLA